MAMRKSSEKKAVTETKNTTNAEGRTTITVPPVRKMYAHVRLKGLSLIMNRMTKEKLDEWRGSQTGEAKSKKPPKNPEKEFQNAKYLDSKGRDCLRGCAIKKALVRAAKNLDGLEMTQVRGWVFVCGDLLPIKYEKCVMREDMVRIKGTNDLRWRPEYLNWSVDVKIEYLANVITASQLIHLLQHAGFSVGLHEWRPERDGDHGRFEIDIGNSKAIGGKAA